MSELEDLFATYWRMLGPLDLQDYACEYRFHPLRKWKFDFCWPEQRVAVEIDGGQWGPHGGRHNTDRDRVKLNQAAMMGWRVLHFSGEMLKDSPTACVQTVIEALAYKDVSRTDNAT